ncbi:hypothetical protein ABZ848_34760 [Streptomyces sp. NPDC047081]|uniref:hypothetical protein n=1 Tax=Streptomyces sp. NPDC047081 TaxID=3154706 RepID=UPI0033F5EFB6
MADEQYRWLNRETAEALLRGESLEAVDATARDQAERLAKTLESLTSQPSPSSAELPGEAAALAAFRTARSRTRAQESRASADVHASDPAPARHGRPDQPAPGHRTRSHASDAGLVRIGGRPGGDDRRRALSRPMRFGLTAVLAAGMAGGVAVAATSGILPIGGDDPAPGASVSAAVSPDRPLISPSPNGLLGKPTPDGSTGGTATPQHTPSPGSSGKPGAEAGGWWKQHAPSTCRDALGGKELAPNRKQALETAAGGLAPERVWKYCKQVLSGGDVTSHDGKKSGKGQERGVGGQGDQNGQGNGNGQGEQGGGPNSGGQGGDDDGNHIAPGGGGSGVGGDVQATVTPLLPGHLLTTESPTPAPDPTYSAL